MSHLCVHHRSHLCVHHMSHLCVHHMRHLCVPHAPRDTEGLAVSSYVWLQQLPIMI